eukprot:CAMPEP_0119094502 /NCGR_PEP_ID=MMETSP1178-20130426/166396_1 /TAXON_ID=33656 /ORGANISM="unid sp, Strain CCMP2000" /LENGTH=62 /DNA_ID=CAMNT_0007078237 /DNA_START=58 /DNA_END=243 /DNA_ORIENTATION=-
MAETVAADAVGLTGVADEVEGAGEAEEAGRVVEDAAAGAAEGGLSDAARRAAPARGVWRRVA